MSRKRAISGDDFSDEEIRAKPLFDRVTNFVTAKEWGYYVVEEGNCISFGIRL